MCCPCLGRKESYFIFPRIHELLFHIKQPTYMKLLQLLSLHNEAHSRNKWTACQPTVDPKQWHNFYISYFHQYLKHQQPPVDTVNKPLASQQMKQPVCTLFSSVHEAPARTSAFTTSAWPPSAASWSGVASVIRFRADITPCLSNFISSSITRMEPCIAAMCAHEFPSWNIEMSVFHQQKPQTLLPTQVNCRTKLITFIFSLLTFYQVHSNIKLLEF